MGYTINLIQDVETGGLWNGERFVEVLTQDDYAQSQFITGDPESIPDNFSGLPLGEYRVMTFLTQGNSAGDFPMINGQPFSNFAGQPVANAVDVTFTGNGGEILLNPSSEFDAVAGMVGMYLIFTLQQVNDNYLEANPFDEVFSIEQFPEYAGTYIMEVYYSRGTYYASGFSGLGAAGPISAQYLFIY
jgi:hypothetical protein